MYNAVKCDECGKVIKMKDTKLKNMVDGKEIYTIKEFSKMANKGVNDIRWHIGRRHIVPIRLKHEGRNKNFFTLNQLSQLRVYFRNTNG